MLALDELATSLGGELGTIAARIERDLKLSFAVEIERLRAERAEFELRVERAVAEKLAALKDGPPGPQGEAGMRGEPGEAITGPSGEQGIQGVRGEAGPAGPEPYVGDVCGLHDPVRAYRKYDLVTFHGSEWRARQDDPGALPGDGWALAGQVGSRGKAGEKGEKGAIGPTGPAGPTIVDWAVKDYRAAPIMSDGSVGPPLDMRAFFELYHAEAAD